MTRIHFHGLRHTCASLALAAGVNIKVVQERLGRTDIGTTLNIYGHCLETEQAAAATRLSVLTHGR